jgi:hypothetical protein
MVKPMGIVVSILLFIFMMLVAIAIFGNYMGWSDPSAPTKKHLKKKEDWHHKDGTHLSANYLRIAKEGKVKQCAIDADMNKVTLPVHKIMHDYIPHNNIASFKSLLLLDGLAIRWHYETESGCPTRASRDGT